MSSKINLSFRRRLLRYHESERRDRNGIRSHPAWRSGIHVVKPVDDSDAEDDAEHEFEVRIPRQHFGARVYTYISEFPFREMLHNFFSFIITSSLRHHYVISISLFQRIVLTSLFAIPIRVHGHHHRPIGMKLLVIAAIKTIGI